MTERANSISNMSGAGSTYSGSRLARSPTNASSVSSNNSSITRSGRASNTSGYPASVIQPGYTGLKGSSLKNGNGSVTSKSINGSGKTNAINTKW